MYETYEQKVKKELFRDLFKAICKLMGSINTILLNLFVILKLTDKINWSWKWVLAPLWIPTIFFVLTLIVAIIATVITKRR